MGAPACHKILKLMEYIIGKQRIIAIGHGEELGEVTFQETEPGVYTINHTFVDENLRGQGIASELVRKAVEEIEFRGGIAKATCSYALLWLARNRGCDTGDIPLYCPIPDKTDN